MATKQDGKLTGKAPAGNTSKQPAGATGSEQGGEGDEQDDESEEQDDEQGGQPADFDTWLAEQGEDIQALVNSRFTTLQNTVAATREERKKIQKQLRQLQQGADKGSELETSLAAINTQLAEQSQRAEFYEAAHAEGALDLPAAFSVLRDAGLIEDDGEVDWKQAKERYALLFRQVTAAPAAKGRAGAGAGGDGSGSVQKSFSMNDWIRNRAGR